MTSQDGTMSIVHNGEVYNFRALRERLEKEGHSFSTESDTEVILHAYRQWGEECLALLKGMFAFCIWDSEKRELFLARDRMGIKPLYYTVLPGNTFLFASEIKALLRYPGMKKTMYVPAIDNLLTYGFNIAPHTFFEGVEQLLPGHCMKVSQRGISRKEYWDIDLEAPLFAGDERELAARLRVEIEEAVRHTLVSDVPVAAYLSGGIDSSAVAGIYSGLSGEQIKTISIRFDEADYDEAEYSREVSRYFTTDHTEFTCTIAHDEVHDLIYFLEYPLTTLLNVPLLALSRKVRDSGFKVVLSGDGADELLGGYDYFKMLKAMHFIQWQESSFRMNILRAVLPSLKTSVHAEIQYMFLKEYPLRYPAFPYRFQEFPWKEQLYSPGYRDMLGACPPEDPLFFDLSNIQHRSLVDQALYIETKMRLLNLTLPLADKMSMAHSVELRPCFLDHDLVNFIFRIPDRYKIRALSEKHILKESMKGFLPDSICRRKKQPLQPPGRWFVDSLFPMVRHYLSEGVVKEKGYFNPDFLTRALADHRDGSRIDYTPVIVVAFFVHLWDEIFLR